MKHLTKAILYTVGTLTVSLITLAVGNLICKGREKEPPCAADAEPDGSET
jgi:hypothetical protein